MCLAVFAIDAHPDWPLVLVANRDEFHVRATEPMQPWPDSPHILAGKDLQAGGTWLGIDTNARLSLLTNVRDPANIKPDAPSRGRLAEQFLAGTMSGQDYLQRIAAESSQYNGFNLVIIDSANMDNAGPNAWHASNYQQPFFGRIQPGVHGLSNALLNTSWPKTERTTASLRHYLSDAALIDSDALSQIMLDNKPVPDALLPRTGLPLARERLLGVPFIVSPTYGTRCTTIILRHRGGLCWVQEDSFNPLGQRTGRVRWWNRPGLRWQETQLDPGSLITT